MAESEIRKLCQDIYRKHKVALDKIFEHVPDQRDDIRGMLESLIKAQAELCLDDCSKTGICFGLAEWDKSPKLKQGEGWTSTKRILLFAFTNLTDSLVLHLYIGPGPKETRERLFNLARTSEVFKPAQALRQKWNNIFRRSFLSQKSYEEADAATLESEIRKHWDKFIKDELPKIAAAIRAAKWIWEA